MIGCLNDVSEEEGKKKKEFIKHLGLCKNCNSDYRAVQIMVTLFGSLDYPHLKNQKENKHNCLHSNEKMFQGRIRGKSNWIQAN